MSFLESLQMPTYAGYVWSSYGLTLMALVWLALHVRRQWRLTMQQVQRRLAANTASGEST